MNNPNSTPWGPPRTLSDRLNQNCFCITLDRQSLCEALERQAGDPEFCEAFIHPKAHLFSNVRVFLSASQLAEMQEVVAAIETTARLAAYKAAVLSQAPEISREDHGRVGALMRYDFHLGGDGPRLIEINTKAGGAFLNALLARVPVLGLALGAVFFGERFGAVQAAGLALVLGGIALVQRRTAVAVKD